MDKEDFITAMIVVFLVLIPVFIGISVYDFLNPQTIWEHFTSFIISVIVALYIAFLLKRTLIGDEK